MPPQPAGSTTNTNTTIVGISPPVNTGSLSVIGNQVVLTGLKGWSGIGVQVTGSVTGGTAVFEASADGQNFFAYSLNTPTGTMVNTISTTGFWQGSIVGLASFRVRMTAITGGVWTVTLNATEASTPAVTAVTVQNTNTGTNAAASAIGQPIPGSADLQGVKIGTALQAVTGLNVGSQNAMTVAIVDGSGTQVTTFGGAGGTSSNINSATPAQATYAGFNDGTNMQGARTYNTNSGGTENTLGVNLRQVHAGGSVEAGITANPLRIDPVGTTAQPVTLSGANTLTTVSTVTTVTNPVTVVGNVADAATDSGDPVLMAGTYTTATPTYTNGQRARARVDASGNLLVNVAAGSAANSAASATGAAVPANAGYTGVNIGGNNTGVTGLSVGSAKAVQVAVVDGSGNQVTTFGGAGGTSSNIGSANPSAATAAGFSDGTNMRMSTVFDEDTGAGTQYCQGVSIRIAGNGGSTEGGTATTPLRIDPTGTTTQPVSGTVSANASQTGTWNVNQAGTWTVQIGNTANTTAILVTERPSTPVLASALSNTPLAISTGACQLTDYYCWNPNSAALYVQLIDSAGTPSVGTTAPKWSIAIPPAAAANVSGLCLTFANKLWAAVTQTATGGAAPGTPLDCNFGYR